MAEEGKHDSKDFLLFDNKESSEEKRYSRRKEEDMSGKSSPRFKSRSSSSRHPSPPHSSREFARYSDHEIHYDLEREPNFHYDPRGRPSPPRYPKEQYDKERRPREDKDKNKDKDKLRTDKDRERAKGNKMEESRELNLNLNLDPYAWLDVFLPYWQATGNIPHDTYRAERHNPKDSNACSTLFVRSLPRDVTKRELEILFRICPNFLRVRLIRNEDPIAFADFVDVPSAHAAILALQGYLIDDVNIHLDYDRKYAK
eukprot:TRINITY_DN6723_c0_g1_i2.p1 TRINITY_DN6723_c0_g1~~TRINITY_DN6723_c0_g1_i2.p1  ORF type:complete len:257 (-),score=57.75 TRINITY_DN6723_c0_g1_i2:39-809(-)